MGEIIVSTAHAMGKLFPILRTMNTYITTAIKNQRRKEELRSYLECIQQTIHDFPAMPRHVFRKAFSELKAINKLLHDSSYCGSVEDESSWLKWISLGICTLCINAKLNDASDRLRILRDVYLLGALVDIKKNFQSMDNENPDLPSDFIGWDRLDKVMDFLEDEKKELRIIGIYGQGGLGKTTLLNKLWTEISNEHRSYVKARVVVGESPTQRDLCSLQSDILKQIDKSVNSTFHGCEFGRGALKKHLGRSRKAIFLAIDNVWEREDIEDLLPDGLAFILPPYSCIVVTSRQLSVVEKLVELSHLQISDSSHVLSYSLDCLSIPDSRNLFARNAHIYNIEEHSPLIDAMVPLCGGLPLALKVLGRLFRCKDKRREAEWRNLYNQMQLDKATFPIESFEVEHALRLSYDKLRPTCQEAFIDVVGFFCGWKWCTVERIVGKTEMAVLKDRSLLSESVSPFQSNDVTDNHIYYPPPLMVGQTIDNFGYPPIIPCQHILKQKNNYVTIHDLTLKFGRSLLEQNSIRSRTVLNDLDYRTEVMPNLQHEGIRFFWYTNSVEDMISPNELQKMKHLRYLYLDASTSRRKWLKLNVDVTFLRSKPLLQEDFAMLRFLSLESIKFSDNEIQRMMSQELRELHLQECKGFIEISDASCIRLKKLETLCIRKCLKFQHISNRCGSWEELQELTIFGCPKILELPIALGTLPKLESFIVIQCHGLKLLPPLSQLKNLSFLNINNCSNFTSLPSLPTNLKSLTVNHSSRFQKIPEEIGMLGSLVMLNLNFSTFRTLPESICDIVTLEVLDLRFCINLEGLPQDLGRLRNLRQLRVTGSEKVDTNIPNLPSGLHIDA